MKLILPTLAILSLSSCAGLSGTSVTYRGHTFTYTSAKGVVSEVEPIEETEKLADWNWFDTVMGLWNLWK